MKRFAFYLLIPFTALLIFTSCTASPTKQKTVDSLIQDGGFIYSEEVPWGTGFDRAKEIYASPSWTRKAISMNHGGFPNPIVSTVRRCSRI